MDLLYLLGNGSAWDNNELRYSLRSACAHVPHDRVIIVGERPAWLRNVVHIPAFDVYPMKVACTWHKLLVACRHEAVGSQFVLMNDDFLFLQDHATPLHTYVRGTIQQRITAGPKHECYYYELMNKAMMGLRSMGIAEPLDFDGHHPMPMRTSSVLSVASKMGDTGAEFAWRSMVGNWHPVRTTYVPDPKLYHWQGAPTDPFISLGEELERYPEFIQWITHRFPDVCRYEA